MTEKKLKTFIKWQGNKSNHVRFLLPLIPKNYNTYIEPFLGSGAVLLKHKPTKWIINDLNKDNIDVWKIIQDNPNKIISYFKNFGKTFKNLSKDKKIKLCNKKTSNLNNSKSQSRAINFLLMKACSFMGTIMKNDVFSFNGLELSILAYNKYPFLSESYFENIKKISQFLNETNGKIYNSDYKKILKKAKANDFIFLDPPYIQSHDYKFNYNKGEKLDNVFIKELVEQVKILDKRDVFWMMTQANTAQIRKSFLGYKFKTFNVFRAVSKSYTKELIIMNY